MQRMRRFARYWDLVGNSGNFVETTPLIWNGGKPPFAEFMSWSEWLFAHVGRTDSIALVRLAELLFQFLTEHLGLEPQSIAETMWRDWQRGGRRDKPEFLRKHLPEQGSVLAPAVRSHAPKRQARHLGSAAGIEFPQRAGTSGVL